MGAAQMGSSLMKEMTVVNMCLRLVGGQFSVTYNRYHTSLPLTQTCKPSDILSRKPLSVKLKIPACSKKHDLRDMAGLMVTVTNLQPPLTVLESE